MSGGDDADFERLMREHGPALARLASWYASSADDADDLLQEIAFGLWRAHGAFRRESSERTFVYRVAHNRAASWLARRQRIPRGDPEALVEVPDERALADRHAEHADERAWLRRVLARLPESYAHVVLLKLEGLSDHEIAEVVGISDGNVAVRLTRARKLLRPFAEELRS